jgi:trigger factor
MVDKQVDMITSQLGKNIPAEKAGDKSLVRGNFDQLDESGETLEGGIKAENVLLAVDLIKDSLIKDAFIGKGKDEVLIFDPVKAYNDRHEVGHLLKIKHEEVENLNSDFRFVITEVLDFEKAKLSEELFKQIYGEETEIKTETDFREKLKTEISANLSYSSEYQFSIDTRNSLVESTNMEFPEPFLKRWLLAVNKQATPEQVDSDFGFFIKDLKWSLIKNKIIDQNDLDVTEEETLDFARRLALAQFQQYGYYNVPDDQLDTFANKILEKPEETERIYKKLFEEKVLGLIRQKALIVEKEISQEEFEKLRK